MLARIVAAGVVLVLVGFVGAFVTIALVGPSQRVDEPSAEPAAADELISTQALAFSGPGEGRRVDGTLAIRQSGAYRLTLRLIDPAGQPPGGELVPTVSTIMVDHPMGPFFARVEREDAGTFHATGLLEMEGQWRFRVGLGNATSDAIVKFRR